MLSVVIPIHNEESSIVSLHDRLTEVLDSLAQPYEIIFVDDGSTDHSHSFKVIADLPDIDARLKVVRLRRNFCQTAALCAGFHEAWGEVVISFDGDLQHDPSDIPALLAKIAEGYDIASGWRKHRVGNSLRRKFPSRGPFAPDRPANVHYRAAQRNSDSNVF
jgi:glycosyltransferase involved in cell wall biosynthesis